MPASENQIHPTEVGVETEDDATLVSLEAIQEAYVTGSDWTTETIVGQLRKGNIDLNPRFQRREVWHRFRKSKLIESIILNLPIPQIVLAERKDKKNTYIVLDGKQRLLTIRQFCVDSQDSRDDEFETLFLQKLGLLDSLNGKCYEAILSNPEYSDIINAFDNHTIRTVVIRNWPNDDYLFRVFRRLNTGSVPLSPQELRQALKPGPFTDFLDEFTSESKPLQEALGLRGPDFRMRDNEVFLRYMSFATRADQYAGNLKRFLDESASRLNTRWIQEEAEIRSEAERCNVAIEATQQVFGSRDAFCIYDGEAFGRRFNRAVFDIMTFYFREQPIRESALQARSRIKQAFVDRSKMDADFQQSLTTTTKSKKATATRFVAWAEELSAVIDRHVVAPNTFVELLSRHAM